MKSFTTRARRIARWMFYVLTIGAPASIWRAYGSSILRKRHTSEWLESERAFRALLKSGDFTADWFTLNVIPWLRVFDRVGWGHNNTAAPLRALEVGSWEGMSSLFILSHFPAVHLTCVDTFQGADEHANHSSLSAVEQRFDANTANFAERVTKWRGTSASYFAATPAVEEFDLIYIDGSHFVDDVLLDSVSGFQRLRPGGVIIFDDYQWRRYANRHENPAAALNAFFRLKADEIELLSAGHQIIARRVKTAERAVSLL